MKKYIVFSILAAFLMSGCVKDEQPEPMGPSPVEYSVLKINELCTKDLTDPYFVDGMGGIQS